jgi:hypothetical protein
MILKNRAQFIVSAAIAAGGIVVPLVIYVLGREYKGLTVETVEQTTLVDLTQDKTGHLELTYKGEPVNQLTAVTLEIRNSGTRPVAATDFERPLVIVLGDSVAVLGASVGEKSPDELSPRLAVGSGNVVISPLLMNPGDRFRITSQVRGRFREPAVHGRILGVSTIRREVLARRNAGAARVATAATAIGALCAYFYLGGLLNGMRARRKSPGRSRAAIWPDLLAIALICMSSAASLGHLALSSFHIHNSGTVQLIAAGVIVLPVFFVGTWRGRWFVSELTPAQSSAAPIG